MKRKTVEFTTKNEKESVELGYSLGRILRAGDVVTLDGDLGAGKTHFTIGIGNALEIKEYITSPTFTIVNEYTSGNIPLYHFDAYRLASSDELYEIGFDEYLNKKGIIVIEWADIVEDILPIDRIEVRIMRQDQKSPFHRIIYITMDERIDEIVSSRN